MGIGRRWGWALAAGALAALAGSAPGGATQGAGPYRSYVNVRYGYAVCYPAALAPQGEADDGDGERFVSADAALTVYGCYDVTSESLAGLCRDACRGDGRVVTYRVLRKNWFVVSGTESGHGPGRVFYDKTLLAGDVVRSLEFVYPARRAAYYGPMAARIARSFRALPLPF